MYNGFAQSPALTSSLWHFLSLNLSQSFSPPVSVLLISMHALNTHMVHNDQIWEARLHLWILIMLLKNILDPQISSFLSL